MAEDDRYRWLDDEAAERLLRGQVVDTRSARRGGRHAPDHNNVEGAPTRAWHRPAPAPSWARGGPVPQQRTPEDHLGSFLDALVDEQTATLHALGAARTGRVQGDASAELPGEDAAVAAFRAAHQAASAGHSGTVDITAGPTEAETVVGRRAAREDRRRSGDRRPGVARRSALMGRPLRAGFAMAVAGCALGGAAVAAGTGVLPTPFGGGGSPAASVSPLASSGGASEDSAGAGGSPQEGNGPRRGTREGDPSDSPGGEDLAGKERGRDRKPEGRADDEGWWHRNGKGLSESDKKAMARALCRAYEDDELSVHDRVRLEMVAGGPEGVKKWCDKHDSVRHGHGPGGADNSGGVGAPGDSGGSGSLGGSSSGDDGGPGGDDGDGGEHSGGESGGGGTRPDDGGGAPVTEGQSGDSDGMASPDAGPSPSADETASAGAE